MATYYYALQVYAGLDTESEPHVKSLYRNPPNNVIDHVIRHVMDKEDGDWPDDIKEAVKLLKQYHDMLTDFNQAQVLQGLGRGLLFILSLLNFGSVNLLWTSVGVKYHMYVIKTFLFQG